MISLVKFFDKLTIRYTANGPFTDFDSFGDKIIVTDFFVLDDDMKKEYRRRKITRPMVNILKLKNISFNGSFISFLGISSFYRSTILSRKKGHMPFNIFMKVV